MIVAAIVLCGSILAADVALAGDGGSPRRVPLIDCTDLYHPHQDPGDNVDLVAAYALPEVDLKAVILDVTQQYRTEGGRRDAGFIPVLQLNSIFNRNVPCGVTPYAKMKSPGDTMPGRSPLSAVRRGIAAESAAGRQRAGRDRQLRFDPRHRGGL